MTPITSHPVDLPFLSSIVSSLPGRFTTSNAAYNARMGERYMPLMRSQSYDFLRIVNRWLHENADTLGIAYTGQPRWINGMRWVGYVHWVRLHRD